MSQMLDLLFDELPNSWRTLYNEEFSDVENYVFKQLMIDLYRLAEVELVGAELTTNL